MRVFSYRRDPRKTYVADSYVFLHVGVAQAWAQEVDSYVFSRVGEAPANPRRPIHTCFQRPAAPPQGPPRSPQCTPGASQAIGSHVFSGISAPSTSFHVFSHVPIIGSPIPITDHRAPTFNSQIPNRITDTDHRSNRSPITDSQLADSRSGVGGRGVAVNHH